MLELLLVVQLASMYVVNAVSLSTNAITPGTWQPAMIVSMTAAVMQSTSTMRISNHRSCGVALHVHRSTYNAWHVRALRHMTWTTTQVVNTCW